MLKNQISIFDTTINIMRMTTAKTHKRIKAVEASLTKA